MTLHPPLSPAAFRTSADWHNVDNRRVKFLAGRDTVDRPRVHTWLSEQAYWAQGRTRATQDAAIDASLNYGVYEEQTGEQIAYARVVTDGVTFGWLCDVFVSPDARGQGIGKILLEGIAAELDRLGLTRTLLTTGDAQGLYAQFGFSAADVPSQWMIRASGR